MTFKDKYYQFRVLGAPDEESQTGLKKVHVIATSYQEGKRKARVITDWEQKSFEAFLRQYNFLKDYVLKPWEGWLHKAELLSSWHEGCLRVFLKDNRLEEENETILLILQQVREVIKSKL